MRSIRLGGIVRGNRGRGASRKRVASKSGTGHCPRPKRSVLNAARRSQAACSRAAASANLAARTSPSSAITG